MSSRYGWRSSHKVVNLGLMGLGVLDLVLPEKPEECYGFLGLQEKSTGNFLFYSRVLRFRAEYLGLIGLEVWDFNQLLD